MYATGMRHANDPRHIVTGQKEHERYWNGYACICIINMYGTWTEPTRHTAIDTNSALNWKLQKWLKTKAANEQIRSAIPT